MWSYCKHWVFVFISVGISYEAADSKGLHEKLYRELNYSALHMALQLNYTNVSSLTQISQAIKLQCLLQ